jgi:hypothetical protein
MRKNAGAIFSRWVSPLWPVTLAGILIGAAIGASAAHGTSESQATALIRIYQPIDADHIMTGTAPTPESQQSYFWGEIAYLTSPGFADAVGKQLNETHPPRLSAIQDGQSSIVSLSSTQPNFVEAQQVVDAALKAYGDHTRQQVRERGQAAIEALNAGIDRLEGEATQARNQSPGPQTDGVPTSDSQRTQIQQLDLQRLAIEAQMERPAALQVVQPTTQMPNTAATAWYLRAVGGGIVGGFLAFAGAYCWRKRVGVVISSSALDGQIERVILPTVRLGAHAESSDNYAGLARSLYAQLPSPRTGRLLVVGSSADSGTGEVTQLIAYAVAEHGPVGVGYLADEAQPLDGLESLADLTGEATMVIDGGSVDASPALLAAAEDASQIIVVVMIGRDFNEAVRVASQLVRGSDTPISAVCTRRGIHRTPSRRNNKHSNRPPGDLMVDGQVVPLGGGETWPRTVDTSPLTPQPNTQPGRPELHLSEVRANPHDPVLCRAQLRVERGGP